MAEASWSRKATLGSFDVSEKLFVFGYSCKIFRDDAKALFIDQGKHLIPWMGDKTLMIDRYDVRGYLHDLRQYEATSESYEDPLSDEESLCDEERYRSLRSDVSEEQLYHEEELKRLRAAIAGDGAYHEIGFSYDNAENQEYVTPDEAKVEEPEDELYQIPEGLTVPKGMEVPYNMKIHAIIEKTALFVSQQGGQMEIIIKMKQHANPQFAFMHLDNPLYPYYKLLVREIKAGSYKPVEPKRVSRSEDEDDDGHYLHPSLMSGRQEVVPKFTVPTINFRRSSDDSYSVLVRNLQQKTVVNEKPESPPAPEPNEQSSHEGSENDQPINHPIASSGPEDENSIVAIPEYMIVPPPPDLQPVVDKMAEYVCKNGEDFEIIVKSKKDKRFDFLHPWHEFYNYYMHKRKCIKLQMSENESANMESGIHTHVPENSIQPQEAENTESADVPVTVVHESGPVLYADLQPDLQVETKMEDHAVMSPPKDELVTVDSQDSQSDIVFGPQQLQQENPEDDSSESMDFLDSPSDSISTKEEPKVKNAKLKGPISFSLKSRDTDTPTDKSKLTPLLLGDDSEEDGSEEAHAEKEENGSNNKRRQSTDEALSRHSKSNTIEPEVKAPKPNSEFLEAKHAEERIRDKLLATARERIAQQRKEKQQQLEQQQREEQLKKEKQQQLDQQRKEKQLQLERKRKADLFLKMLKSNNPDSTAVVSHILASDKTSSSHQNSEFWDLPDASQTNRLLFPTSKLLLSTNNYPVIKTEWSSDSNQEMSGEEEPISVIGEKLSSDPESVEKQPSPVKQERKKKKKKRSHSKIRERSSRTDKSKLSKRNKDRYRSRSPPRNYKHEKGKKEKELPAAYALTQRSRSRSRSPRRYRQSFNHWSRRR